MFNFKTFFVAAAAVFIVAAPLAADAHDHRDRHDHRGWERSYGPPPGHWRHDYDRRRYVPPPPVVYVPRPVYPPPIAYAPPPPSFSIVVPFNLR